MNRKQKDELIAKAIAVRFKPEVGELELRRQAFAAEALLAHTGPAPSLNKNWISYTSKITICTDNTGFEYFNRYNRPADYEPLLDYEIKLQPSQPTDLHVRNGQLVKVTDKKLIKKADRIVLDIKAHIAERENLRIALEALLATVRTYNQLVKAWPDGEPFYEHMKPVPKTRELVDPNVLKLLNKELLK